MISNYIKIAWRNLFKNKGYSVGNGRGVIEERVIAAGEKKFTQKGYFIQPEGPEMLTLNMIYGTRQGLSILFIVISTSL